MAAEDTRTVTCPKCKHDLKLPADWTGLVQCAYCSKLIRSDRVGTRSTASASVADIPAGSSSGPRPRRYPFVTLAVIVILGFVSLRVIQKLPEHDSDADPAPAAAPQAAPVAAPAPSAPVPVDAPMNGPGEPVAADPQTRRLVLHTPAPVDAPVAEPAIPPELPRRLKEIVADPPTAERPRGIGTVTMPAPAREDVPVYDGELEGGNEVRVDNPNNRAVQVEIRSGMKNKRFTVPPRSVRSVWVPNGSFQVFFVYSDEPDAVYQGDDFTLNDNGVLINLVQQVNGNFGIRRVK